MRVALRHGAKRQRMTAHAAVASVVANRGSPHDETCARDLGALCAANGPSPGHRRRPRRQEPLRRRSLPAVGQHPVLSRQVHGRNPSGLHGSRTMKRIFLIASLMLAAPVARSQDADELAKKLSNPVASLISVPLQYNADFNLGSEDGTKQTLNIQPVIPTSISEDWNLITRVIAPVVYQDDVFGNSGSQFGLGDITPTFFFSPKAPTAGGWIWAVGPVFLLPAATDDLLGAEKWGIGPSALVLKQTKAGWTYGALPTTSDRWPARMTARTSAARSCNHSWPRASRV